MMKKLFCLAVCLMLAAMSMTACGQKPAAQETLAPAAQTEAPATAPVETTAAETLPQETEARETEPQSGVLENNSVPVGCFEIETPYCMLTYPMTWQNCIAIEQEQTADGCVVSFYALLEGKEDLRVFDVIFGGTEGDMVGRIDTAEGSVPVYFRTYSVQENADLNYDESEMLMGMVEDINVIYTGLNALAQFN